ncbi:response regulator [Paragemmobacter ruber]|uniref:Response regulator n=1 Tax=Paragemmobacter ruber TaxID=1985673 RepID=A0ABW9Y1N3_9RHOB|nr:response regulator transcription factor [Rhodobacter ruber]NBE06413.1 response regulator [Rhodobacter ruber]
MTEPIQIVVADDHPLLREGVVLSLVESGAFVVVGQAGDALEAVAKVEAHMPDIVLLDVSMPGSGLKAAATISARFPAIKIVMLTISEADDDLLEALRAGARGYVLKGVSAAELVEVLQGVATGGSYVPPALAARVLASMQGRGPREVPEAEALVPREAEILRLVATGRSNKEIARELDLQEKTVKHYMTNILQKLQVRNRVEAALKAREMGL